MTTHPAPLPAVGDSFTLTRGFVPFVTLCTAATGSGRERVLIDPDDDAVSLSESTVNTTTTYTFTASSLSTENHGEISLTATMVSTGTIGGAYDVTVAASDVPSTLAVEAIGIAWEHTASSTRTQYLLSPAFSGVVFQQPASTLQQANDLNVSASMQLMAFWSSDGTGLSVQGLDATGYKPKWFRFEPADDDSYTRCFAGNWCAGSDTGGASKQTLHTWRIRPYHYDPAKTDGWKPVADYYRAWLESNATDTGNLLERGRLETRGDVSDWLREIDLLVVDTASWYPDSATVGAPFEELTAHQSELGATNVLLALWAWTRPENEGKVGTWYPRTQLATEISNLSGSGIKTAGYTWPHAFDTANDAYTSPVTAYTVEDRNGSVVTETGSGNTYAVMDVAEPGLADYYQSLATYHAENFSVAGFYTDLPTTAGQADFNRSEGIETGISSAGYEGMAAIHEHMLEGGGAGFAILHEACLEWLVRTATLGQGTTLTYARVYPQEDLTYGIPFFQTVYSGYCAFWPADPALGTQTLSVVPTAYGDFTEFNISRLQAEGAVLGGIPNTSEIYMPEGKMFYEKTVGDTDIDAWLQHHKAVMASAVAMRAASRDHLVYGQMLDDPSTTGRDESAMGLNVLYQSTGLTYSEDYTKPAVNTRAWKAPNGSIRIYAFNGTNAAASTVVDPSKIGKPNARKLRDVSSNAEFDIVTKADSKTRTASVTVPAGGYRLLEVV